LKFNGQAGESNFFFATKNKMSDEIEKNDWKELSTEEKCKDKVI
jgi:hypothetical protein